MTQFAKNDQVGGENPPTSVDETEEKKYIEKVDGELIRHINKKSSYLRDMLEIPS